MTITNAVRGGGDLHSESPLQGSSCNSPRPDPNYQRIKRFRDAALRREQNCTGDMAANAHIERLILDTILEGWR